MRDGPVGHIHGEAVSKAMRRNRAKAFEVPTCARTICAEPCERLSASKALRMRAARVLNHARPGIGNQHYNHAKMLPQVRGALELLATYVEAACGEDATEQLASMAP